MADLRRWTRPSRRLAGFLTVITLAAAGSLSAQPPAAPPGQRAAPSKLTVRGTVVDEQGKPVAGATVGGTIVTTVDQGNGQFTMGFTIKEQTTDSQGAFAVEVF